MFEKINAYAKRCLAFEADELDYFDSLLKHKFQPKKTFLLQEGEICQFEAYILKGCIRTYHRPVGCRGNIAVCSRRLVGKRYYQFS